MTQPVQPVPPLSLYVHVPFCAVRCHYCDFNTYAGLSNLFEPYTAALVAEISAAGERYGRPRVRTVFLGGGTPTVLPRPLLARIAEAWGTAFDVAPDAEITCEANPGTADAEVFDGLLGLGVNRLSMGVQSFDDDELKWLGRVHAADEAENAYRLARAAGFTNINLDFMFGLPGQDPDTWRRTLAHAIALRPEHLSLYSLTVEHGTPLARSVQLGQASAPDDDLAADLFEIAQGTLTSAGYAQYEVSNYALPGRECRHNLVYWRHEPYFGFGPGAHSFYSDGRQRRRWWNVRPVPEYIQRVQAARSPERDGETIDDRTAMGETMMLGLRLLEEGVEEARFRRRFNVGLDTAFPEEIRRLVRQGLLERLPDRVRLTERGRLLGNRVFAEFLAP